MADDVGESMARTDADEAAPSRAWPDWALVLALLACAALLHGWMVAHTEVMARDGIGYIRYACKFEGSTWREVVGSMEQHPGYPAYLLLMSYPVRYFLGTTPDSMVLSAQLANALAAVLLVIPMYYLGREFFGQREAFGAALLFHVLPVSLEVTSDGLSEGFYLLMAVSSLCLTARALRTRSLWRLGLAGFLGGLAYLTRPEGALVVLAAAATLLGIQWQLPEWRWPWRKVALGLTCLGLASLLSASPYLAVTGSFTKKPTARKMLGDKPQKQKESTHLPPVPQATGFTRSPVLAQILGVWWTVPEGSNGRPPLVWCVRAMLTETARSLQFIFAIPVLIGFFLCRPWLRLPQAWLLVTTCSLNALILVWLAWTMGYVSERHTLLISACCMLPATLALQRMAEWLLSRFTWPPLRSPRVGWFLWLALIGLLLPTSLRPLHANRAGHRAAGHWLAEHARPCDKVVDPFCWAHYFSGQVLLEGQKPDPPPGSPRIHYVIVEQSRNPHVRLKELPGAIEMANQGTCVYRWEPTGNLKKQAEVVEIYSVILPENPDDL